MRYREHGQPGRFADVADVGANGPLGVLIQPGGGLVENQQAWPVQKGPRDRDPLPLAARETIPALTHDRVQTLRRFGDELAGTRSFQSLHHCRVRNALHV